MAAESSRNSGESPRSSWPNAPALHANPTTPAIFIQRIPTVFKFWNTILLLLVIHPGSCCPSVSLKQRHSDESSIFLPYSNCPTVNVFLWCLFCKLIIFNFKISDLVNLLWLPLCRTKHQSNNSHIQYNSKNAEYLTIGFTLLCRKRLVRLLLQKFHKGKKSCNYLYLFFSEKYMQLIIHRRELRDY